MTIETHSVLNKLCAAVDKHRNRVDRARERVEELRERYKAASILERREIAPKGFRAKHVLEEAEAMLRSAEFALAEEEKRLFQPDSFLRFG